MGILAYYLNKIARYVARTSQINISRIPSNVHTIPFPDKIIKTKVVKRLFLFIFIFCFWVPKVQRLQKVTAESTEIWTRFCTWNANACYLPGPLESFFTFFFYERNKLCNITEIYIWSPGQTIVTLLGTTCCARLVTLLRNVARMPGRNNVARTWSNDYNVMQHPQMCGKFKHFKIWTHNTQYVATRRNRVAKRAQHAVTCCTQQCRDMLRWHAGIVWP